MHLRELTQFLAELSEQNNRAWFTMNKPRYDILRAEFLTVITNAIALMREYDPELEACNPRKALFRINRDIRFSKNKEPYKTYFSASMLPSNLKKPSQGGGPAYYFHIDANANLLIAAGEYMPPPDRLRAIRTRIVADPEGFDALLKDKKLADHFGRLQEEGKLVRPPKGFDTNSPHAEYLKLKSFIVWKEENVHASKLEALEEHLATQYRHAVPIVHWLRGIPPS